MRRLFKITVIVAIAFGACIGVIAVIEVQTKIVRRAYDNFVLDNRNHYLPCEKLPTEAEVSRVMEQHQDTIRAIEQVNPGFVGVDIDASACPGRADLVIWYASHQDRLAIGGIIGGDTFFGIPYRLQNR
jgi:Holliday junction resolvasome RuvABC endonuclease subunit